MKRTKKTVRIAVEMDVDVTFDYEPGSMHHNMNGDGSAQPGAAAQVSRVISVEALLHDHKGPTNMAMEIYPMLDVPTIARLREDIEEALNSGEWSSDT